MNMKLKNMYRTLLATALLLMSASPACAAEASGQSATTQSTTDAAMPNDQQRWAAFPVIASSPETGQMLGGMLFYFFPVEEPGQQASTIDVMAFGTTKKQYGVQVSPNIFFDSGHYRLNMMLGYNVWEANYYAIGNDSPATAEKYKSSNLAGSLTLERRITDSIVLDLLGVYEDVNKMTVVPGGMLQAGNIPGAQGGSYVGLGLEGGYDTRDNTNSPSKGAVIKYRYVKYATRLGSDLNFRLQNWDVRYYQQTSWVTDSVMAFAATLRRSSGDVPFYHLPSPDGTLVLRGIENGRYKDRDMLALQSEYRFPIHGKFSGTVFAEAAQVAPTLSAMNMSRFITSVGAGFRYALNPSQRFNLRGDVAYVDKGIGIIVNVREAF